MFAHEYDRQELLKQVPQVSACHHTWQSLA